MNHKFEDLIKDFCRLCGIADIASVAAGAAIDVDGVHFSIAYAEALPDRLCVFCDYGEVPEGREKEVYRALLETNLFVYPDDTAVFSVSPETGRVICATRFRLDPLRAEELRDIMTSLSQKAREWRVHFFDIASTAPTPIKRNGHAQRMATAAKSR